MIATQSASAVARSSGHSIHLANRHTISPADDASGSMMDAAPADTLVAWWSMVRVGSFSAKGRTSGGRRFGAAQST